MNMPIQKFQLALAVALALTSLSLYSPSVQTQPNILLSQTPPPPPKDPPPPPNKTTPGGGLDPDNSSCKKTNKPLTAIVPVNSEQGLTISAHPTFWFYIPYASEDVRSGIFSLLTRDGKKRLYRTAFTLPKTPGIVNISLPNSPEYALEEGNFYHWYLELSCESNATSIPDLEVNGWVKRIPQTPDRDRQIDAATPDVWYDAITRLGTRILASPDNETLKTQWFQLLKFADLQELEKEKLVGTVQVSEQ